jgi:citronellol/citronellal dehydrogenase
MKLKSKVAVVTGASRGIGKAIAIGLAREGVDVAVVARTESESPKLPGTIYKTVEEIHSLGGNAIPIRCDITEEIAVGQMVNQVLNKWGRVDILVNNAAVAFYAPLVDMPIRRWDLVVAVNLRGTFLCTKAFLPKMMEQKSGSIINVSSMAASRKVINPEGAAYVVTKAAIERLTTALAAEVAKYNIAVNCIKPKWIVDTEGMRFRNPNADWERWDSPDRMVAAAVFLAAQNVGGVTSLIATDEEICLWYNLTSDD